MTTLGPRTRAAIAEGPKNQPVNQTIQSPDAGAPIVHIYFKIESARDFARRVALIAHAEGFAAGAKAQREMEPTDEMLDAGVDAWDAHASGVRALVDLDGTLLEIIKAMQRVAPLAGEEK